MMPPVFQINVPTRAQGDLSWHFAKPCWFIYLFIFIMPTPPSHPLRYTLSLLVPVYHLLKGYVFIHSRKGDTTSISSDSYQIG